MILSEEFAVLIPKCPVCDGTERYYSFVLNDKRFDQCKDCGLLTRTKTTFARNDNDVGSVGDAPEPIENGVGRALFTLLQKYVPGANLRVGIIGTATPALLAEGERLGFRPSVVSHGKLIETYDVVVAFNIIEESSTPVSFVESLRGYLVAGGTLVVATRQLVKPQVRAPSSRVLDQHHSFSDTNLQTVFWKAGFADLFLSHHVASTDPIRSEPWFNEQTFAFGRMHARRASPRLSVIVPVFNEVNTVAQLLDGVLARNIPGIDLEIVVVESGSTDGSREIVARYQADPRFKIIFEDKPRGKGHAVRNGLRHATGDVFLIQDADLEYDLLDYEMLISPILTGRAAFVLGTRHAGDWKIRKFARNHLANAMNVAHWALVFAVNVLYEQSMTDPFTMFKVFRSDCISGLEFECQRFDFDFELVCKLVRKGYVPLEVPVNYQSRSFEEGKKVRVFRDPPTWLRAMLKYRNGGPRHIVDTSGILKALEQGARPELDERNAAELTSEPLRSDGSRRRS
jgi:glycosyltransferase involved in cell wall biosynthesis